MEVGKARTIGIGILLAFGLMGCGKVSKDNTRVLASVGGEKITQQAFAETVRLYLGETKAKDVLTNTALREQRNQILGTLVNQKALMQWVKAEGLDRDPKVQIEITSALAGAYFQILTDRLVPKAEPTDAELKAFYDDYLLQAKAAGQGAQVPPFDQVKAQLPAAWKQRQTQVARESLLTQLNQRYPVVFDPDYRPNQVP